MLNITIEIPEKTSLEAIKAEISLRKLAKNITVENLFFLAELSEKKNINEKIQSKKLIIKSLI